MKSGAPLRFREDGTFKIVQLTDMHWKNGDSGDERTARLVETVLRCEQPDFVMLTGDVIDSKHCDDPRRSFAEAVAAVERFGKPWAAVFGNHDTEKDVSRHELMAIMQQLPGCLAEPGPSGLQGVGNYALPVLGAGGAPAAVMYCLDSGEYAPDELPPDGYAWIRREQIGWYEQTSERYANDNGGRPVPALAFFHIPLPEYGEVWERGACRGVKLEHVCSPKINSGLFAAMVERQDVMGVFVGHDHVNDYDGELHGIRLCYGRASGYNTYGEDKLAKGARVIRLTEGRRGLETWLRLADGTEVRQQPEREG